jgi:hypothetical protein
MCCYGYRRAGRLGTIVLQVERGRLSSVGRRVYEVLVRNLIGLLVVLVIVFISYKVYFSELQSTGSGSPARAVDAVGVENDLLAIAQAERTYQAEQSSYASLGELTSSGRLAMSKPGRGGYTYEIETSANNFRVVARCPEATSPGCTNYAVDNTMEVHAVP